ncbi:hypothetical protein DRP04_02180 [Archaeoglobales archaeon]|nr:MAG: hypothetical protein DRP04_02180 [Archaeoglobales archaeon]
MRKVVFLIILLFLVHPAVGMDVKFGEEKNLQLLTLEKSIGIKEGKVEVVELHIDRTKCKLLKLHNYDLLHIDGLELRTVTGEPMLPFKTIVLKLKGDVIINGVSVIKGRYLEILDKLYITPAPKPYIWSNEGAYIPKAKVYSLKSYYPGKIVSYDVGKDNEYTYVYLKIYPIQYIPSDSKVILIHDLRINVYYREKVRISQSPSDIEAIIVTSNDLLNQAKFLANIHNQSGISTVVMTVDEIRSSYSPAQDPPFMGYKDDKPGRENITNYDYDTAKRIINFLRDAREIYPNLKYVVIFGDSSKVPPSYYYFDEDYYYNYEKDCYNSWIPTDLFYSSPDYDFVPNYAVGRIPVRNVEDAENFIDTLNDYYEHLDYSWFNNFAVVGGRPFNSPFYIGELIDTNLINKYLDGFNVIKYYRTDGKFNNRSIEFEGKGFLFHIGHGSGDAWCLEGSPITVNDLQNVGRKPIVISVACMNGAFDTSLYPNTQYAKVRSLSFGEGVLLKGSGIAYIGGSRVNQGSPIFARNFGMLNVYKVTQMVALITYTVKEYENHSVLGDMTKEAIKDYLSINTLDESSAKRALFEFVLLGDPALKLLPKVKSDKGVVPTLIAKNAIKYASNAPIFSTDGELELQTFGAESLKLVEISPESFRVNPKEFKLESPNFIVRAVNNTTGKEKWLTGCIAYPLAISKTVELTSNGKSVKVPMIFLSKPNLDKVYVLGFGSSPSYRGMWLAFSWKDQMNVVANAMGCDAIYVRNTVTGDLLQVTVNEIKVENGIVTEWTSCENPSISPDGRYIAYVESYTFMQQETGQTIYHLYCVDLKSLDLENNPLGFEVPNTNPWQINFPFDVDWLPNGKIVYSVLNVVDGYGTQGYPAGIYSIYPNGSCKFGIVVQNPEDFPISDDLMTVFYSYHFRDLAVSPSGEKIAYVLQIVEVYSDYSAKYRTQIRLVNPDGSNSPGDVVYEDVVDSYASQYIPPTIVSPTFIDEDTIEFVKVTWIDPITPEKFEIYTVKTDGTVEKVGEGFESLSYSNIGKVISPPKADFDFEVADSTVQFNNKSSGSIVARLWFFDDGAISNDINPVHKYRIGGVHNVTLIVVEDDFEADSVTKAVTVTIKGDFNLANVTTSPQTAVISPDSSSTIDIVLDKVPTGLDYANLSVSISNSTVAEIIDIEFPTWATLTDNSTLPASNVWFKAGDLNDQVKAGDTNVVLATLTIKGLAEGTSDITITVNSFTDDNYNEIKDQISTISGTINVSTAVTPPPAAKNIIKFDYGAIVKVEVISVPESGEDTIIQVVSETTGETVFSETISGTGSLDITGLELGNYYMKVINAGNILNTSDPTTWDKKSVGADFVEIGDGNFDIKIKGASDVEWVNDEAPLIIQIKTAVVAGPPPIDGHQPKDLDGDGLFEDVNGDGYFNFGDIVFFFKNFDKDEIKNYPEFYDFNGDGKVNFGDVIGLFFML